MGHLRNQAEPLSSVGLERIGLGCVHSSCWDHHVPTTVVRNPLLRCLMIVLPPSPPLLGLFGPLALASSGCPRKPLQHWSPLQLGSLAPTVCPDRSSFPH